MEVLILAGILSSAPLVVEEVDILCAMVFWIVVRWCSARLFFGEASSDVFSDNLDRRINTMVFIDQADLPWDLNTIPTLCHSEALSILVEAGYIQFEMLQLEISGEDGLINHFLP